MRAELPFAGRFSRGANSILTSPDRRRAVQVLARVGGAFSAAFRGFGTTVDAACEADHEEESGTKKGGGGRERQSMAATKRCVCRNSAPHRA